MQITGTYLKKAAALLMLGLFAFILAEKNTHEHTRYSTDDIQGQTMVHHPGTCLICDFQLASDADLPVLTEQSLLPVEWNPFICSSSGVYHSFTFSSASLRGPPASGYIFFS